jgi:serine/threonine protein kinase
VSTLTKAGRYELHEELGRGAMGVVYRGYDPVIGRDVAVKTMHLSEAGTGMSREELVTRFQTEARAAGLLTHPNIVVVHDAGEQEGVFYITMEMVRGRSLQTLLDACQLFPLPRVMRLMEQACSALDFAHQRNVVHRDIKPANLVLTEDDTLKITDFGTAKILQFGTAQTAHVMGTPSYMSPEQVKGKPVDGRSDIFSLGVILYELMTGEKPFPGQNITTVIYKIVNEDPIPPRALDSSIHPGLSAVIERALAKDPAARFQSCHELLEALKNYRDMVIPEPPGRVSHPNPQPAAPTHSSAQSSRPPAADAGPRATAASASAQPVVISTAEENEAAQKRGRLVLVAVLLAIIGFTGYRAWPVMTDLWQRIHHPVENPAPMNKSMGTPAGNLGLDLSRGASPIKAEFH